MHTFKQIKRYLIPIFLLLVIVLGLSCNTSTELQFIRSSPPVTFLIPTGFQGNLRVVYEEPCGMQTRLENGRQLFEVPVNGVLVLQKKNESLDTKDADYYFVNAAGSRKKIRQVIDKQQQYTLDKTGEKQYLNNGNTSFKDRKESEPVIVIKGVAYKSLEVLHYVNGKLMNKGKTGAEYMEYGVYNAGPIDSTILNVSPEKVGLIEEVVSSCRKKVRAEKTQ